MAQQQVTHASEIGAIVRQLRKDSGVRQDDLAAMVGRSHVTLRELEQGKTTVALGTVLQVLEELGVRVYLDVPT
ncbi:helix-turn-helix domain-containing protein [Pseudomonas sp. NPDC007930]|uniref:helix-turn-helix domain-containing protein n=1 Tax=Pseudomonas sp. NPDC007930 TaxID=3364417 RepID=UPI0036F1837F